MESTGKLFVKGRLSPPRTQGSAGYDLYSTEWVCISPHGSAVISTGVKLEIPQGCCALVVGRSGLAFNHDVFAFTGLIDSDYRGEVKVKLFNFGDVPYVMQEGDRVAQLLFVSHKAFDLEFVDKLASSSRGEDGFGSTGK